MHLIAAITQRAYLLKILFSAAKMPLIFSIFSSLFLGLFHDRKLDFNGGKCPHFNSTNQELWLLLWDVTFTVTIYFLCSQMFLSQCRRWMNDTNCKLAAFILHMNNERGSNQQLKWYRVMSFIQAFYFCQQPGLKVTDKCNKSDAMTHFPHRSGEMQQQWW